MAAILDGEGGASCHLCTCCRNQSKGIDLIKQGFPINRSIDLSLEIINKVDEDDYISLPSKDRFGKTHKPENIHSASPLYGYLRIFGWFKLVYHLQAGENSPKIINHWNLFVVYYVKKLTLVSTVSLLIVVKPQQEMWFELVYNK